MAWREEVRGSAKVPYNPHARGSGFGYGNATDPATWGTREQAEARAAAMANGRMTGAGIVLGPIAAGGDRPIHSINFDKQGDPP
jgi:hypothetical protein